MVYLAKVNSSELCQERTSLMPEAQARRAFSTQLKLIAAALFSLLLTALWPSGPAFALSAGDIQSTAAVLMDADTGQVLYQKQMNEKHKPASITKIMTCLLALEKGDLTDTFTMSYDAVFDVPRDSSHIALDVDEELSLKDALYALMLESANEAANGIAEYISGSMTDFAKRMTERAAELGAKNTNFVNANGLEDAEHYTTAYDMAMITREAIKHPDFITIAGTTRYDMQPTNKQKEVRNFNNKNKMIYGNSSFTYEGILGGKTGYTSAAKNTLVEVARRDGRTLIAVMLEAPSANATFADARLLLDYGFDCFTPYPFSDKEYQESYSLLLHKDVPSDKVKLDYGAPAVRNDGSSAVEVKISVPTSYSGLMYPELGSYTLTTAAPAPDVSAMGAVNQPDSEAGGLLSRLPGWLRFLLKTILYLFIGLVLAACFFRTRRYLRRKKRAEAKRRRLERESLRRQQEYYAQGFGQAPRPQSRGSAYGGSQAQQYGRPQQPGRSPQTNRAQRSNRGRHY